MARLSIRCPGLSCQWRPVPLSSSSQVPWISQPHPHLAAFLKYFVIFGLLLAFLVLLTFAVVESDRFLPAAGIDGYMQRMAFGEATDTRDPNLYYGIVVDCGSSGSRVFVYSWPRHTGNPAQLLDIRQMRDLQGRPVVKRITPGLSTLASNPDEASAYLKPLLQYAAYHIPRNKHKETPLYILATAGMRMLSESDQEDILDNLRENVPLDYEFLFSDTHVEVISGKQEGVYAWIGINFVLGRFNHAEEDDPMVKVEFDQTSLSEPSQLPSILRKRTVGVLDMGGGSLQIAFEVPKSVRIDKDDISKSLIAEFNLGCDKHHTEHVYRVYVSTFLGYGSNSILKLYREQMANTSRSTSIRDPCLPRDMPLEHTTQDDRHIHFKGTGDYSACRINLQPFLNKTVPCQKQPCSFNGVYQPNIDFKNSEFYGFSEFWYSMEDVLRIGGKYEYKKFEKAASDFCSTRWSLLEDRYEKGLYPQADEYRFRSQCFKSAWMATIMHDGFSFPTNYSSLRSAQLIYDREVQWTLGAILYRTRFLPLKEIQAGILQQQSSYKPPWVRVSALTGYQYIFFLCFGIVVAAIFFYIRRMGGRRISPVRSPLHHVPSMSYFMVDEGMV
ncbi:ectonucleoside triphosphate diphosphohydrolase 4-like isoform X1 [Branchiostoma floridae x Branchiostoma japonicum]